jgi:3-oxoacyl-[acyl-carrier-protein] synthase II
MSMGRRRVWVTGTGIVSALGDDMATVWELLRAGQTGIAGLRLDGLEDFRCRIGAQVDDARLAARLAPLGPRPGDRALECAMVATEAALREAGLPAGPESPPQNMPVLFGTGIGSTESYMDCITAFGARGPRGLRPTSIPRCMANAISARISMRFRLTGANYAIVSACTSATNAIGIAFRMVRDGYVDRALCGGTDATFDPFLFGGWNSLGVLARGADPACACRPFDRDRDGCVLGEGAGALVLEAADVAARAARSPWASCWATANPLTPATSPAPASKGRPPPSRPLWPARSWRPRRWATSAPTAPPRARMTSANAPRSVPPSAPTPTGFRPAR